MRYTPQTHKVIAIDLDGTIWPDCFPGVDTAYKQAIETINKMQECGYEVVIWTSRGGDNLDECRKALIKQGLSETIRFNEHATYFTDQYPVISPKIGAHVYLDDKAYGSPDYENYWPTIAKKFL